MIGLVNVFGFDISLMALLVGVLSGAYYGIAYYIKEIIQKNEPFDAVKYSRALTLGAVVGFVAALRGLTFESAEQVLANSASFFLVVMIVDQLLVPVLSGFFERLLKSIQDKLLPHH